MVYWERIVISEASVKVLVKDGLKIPPAGLKITRGRGGSIRASRIENAPKKAAAAKPAKRKAQAKKN